MTENLISQIRACTVCAKSLPYPPRPILSASPESRIIIIGQAPGLRVQESGIPWADASGDNLRKWLGVDHDTFYDTSIFAIVPMGFCYPGKWKTGDLPPRPECAPLWHKKLLEYIKNPTLILLVGQYAQHYYLGDQAKETLTETVKNYKAYLPKYLPIPHPSPRNNIWMAKNPWFAEEVLPFLKKQVREAIQAK